MFWMLDSYKIRDLSEFFLFVVVFLLDIELSSANSDNFYSF